MPARTTRLNLAIEHALKGNPESTEFQTYLDELSVSGTGQIDAASDNVAIVVGADYDGKPVSVSLNFVDATLTNLLTAVWNGSGTLTITGNANATANTAVSYIVAGT